MGLRVLYCRKMFLRRNNNRTVIYSILATAFLIVLLGFHLFLQSTSEWEKCSPIQQSKATINTKEVYQTFDFNAEWITNWKFWNEFYENRFQEQSEKRKKFPLKVFILPHSHNDPGWLKTFLSYYEADTREILNLIVEKLTEYEDMKFVWSEISFLDLWWEQANAVQQRAFKSLVKSKRLEIMTGGWVMTDEANTHIYAILDQLIEGHQWVKSKFDVHPKIGWSIDPFGQGSTVPHLLAKSGLKGAIIQRIHYNWKEWFARHQNGDFYWKPLWNNGKDSSYTLLTHNMPFDIYTTSKSCGPNEEACIQFNFNNDWITSDAERITNSNIEYFSKILIKQYAKTASLFPHNVALVLVGEDFAFKNAEEFKQQYLNYKKIIDYVNKNSEIMFNGSTIQFGTPSDYFEEIVRRQRGNFPSLIGDFFPYADIFNGGSPAYWTGYYTTRPFYKLLGRNLEHNLRNSEILYSIAYNKAKQSYLSYKEARRMEKDYEFIVEARKNLGLFQHHDAITGTSQAHVIIDHLNRLQNGIRKSLDIQQQMIEFLLQINQEREKNFLFYELEKERADRMAVKKVIRITEKHPQQKIILFNSLTTRRIEVISLHATEVNVKILDQNGRSLPFQINPLLKNGMIMTDIKELLIVVTLPALSISTLTLMLDENDLKNNAAKITTNSDGIQELFIENSKMKLIFNETSGLLKEMFMKENDKYLKTELYFGAYNSIHYESGAYLFKPENEIHELNDILDMRIIVCEGSIASDLTLIQGEFLSHTIRIFHTNTHLDDAISITNTVDFGSDDKNRNVEFIMKLKTSINNSKNAGEPEFFTDQNGFQWQPRRKVSSLGIEGNYYPITTSIFIQDDSTRVTLMTTHAQGATSFQNGELEVMLDRRTVYDDGRGMNEGVLDSVKMQHSFMLTFESFQNEKLNNISTYQAPSLFVHHLSNCLNYPINAFVVDNKFEVQLHSHVKLLNHQLPCDIHLVNLRSITDSELPWLPSQSSLLILHRHGYECQLINENFSDFVCAYNDDIETIQLIKNLRIKAINEASLTGLEVNGKIWSFQRNFIKPMELKTYYVTYY